MRQLTPNDPDLHRIHVDQFPDAGSLVIRRLSTADGRLQLVLVHPDDVPRLRAALERWDARQAARP